MNIKITLKAFDIVVVCAALKEMLVTVDSGSSPDHDKLGEELGKVKCLLGGGGTHRTYKDGTKPYYK